MIHFFAILFFLTGFSSQAHAVFSHVQGGVGANAGAALSASVILTSNPIPGNMIVCSLAYRNPGQTATSINAAVTKDSNGNLYTVSTNSPSTYNNAAGQAIVIYLLNAPANASKTITVGVNTTSSYMQLFCDEFSASSGNVFIDIDAGGAGTVGTAVNSPTLTPGFAGELMYAGCSVQNTLTSANAPWTLGGGGLSNGNGTEYNLAVSSPLAVNFTIASTGSQWSCMSIAFKETKTAFTHIQGGATSPGNSGTTAVTTLPANPTAGNAIVCGVVYANGGTTSTTIVSAKDANNNAYTVSANSPSVIQSFSGQAFIFYLLKAPANANQTITVTFSDSAQTYSRIWCDEFQAASGTVVFDTDGKQSTSGTPTNGPTLIAKHAGELMYAICSDANTLGTVYSPWTIGAGGLQNGNQSAYDLSSPISLMVNMDTSNDQWTCMGAVFDLKIPSGFPILQ